MNWPKSEALYKRAKRLMPGGVNSPVRAFQPYPFFTSHAEGSRLHDQDGNVYIDYCMAYGPLILGHAHPTVMNAVRPQLERGTMYGTPTEIEVELAELVSEIVPCVEMMRLINSGTEATMHAIRVARGHTGRDKIVKFEGCYHGAHDYVLGKAGSGATTFGAPTSLGIPSDTTKNTIVLPFNNIELFEKTIQRDGNEIAAVIIEPIIGNAGVISPRKNYLREIRRITEKNDVLLIFDEVITGFRLSLGGAQECFKIMPDLVTLGKIMGGGFPIAAFGGREDLMKNVSPLGKVYQAGTLSGNPVSVTAGLTTLKILRRNQSTLYSRLETMCISLRKGLQDILKDLNTVAQVNSIASMFQIFFTGEEVVDYDTAKISNIKKFTNFHQQLMKNGVFIPPSQFETCFISTAHTEDDINKTLKAFESALRAI